MTRAEIKKYVENKLKCKVEFITKLDNNLYQLRISENEHQKRTITINTSNGIEIKEPS
jgi:hypothetical protein